jgi:hypothetical protein
MSDPQIANHAEWIGGVRAGEFEAIPETFAWKDSAEFAHLINGYELARKLGLGREPTLNGEAAPDDVGPVGPLGNFANRKREEAKKEGRWDGSAIELWICLFFEHRRERWASACLPADPDPMLDELCRTLRAKLVAVPPQERSALVGLQDRG